MLAQSKIANSKYFPYYKSSILTYTMKVFLLIQNHIMAYINLFIHLLYDKCVE